MEKAPALIEETGREYEKMFGRYLGQVEDYRCEDADLILITSGTAGYTARVGVDLLRRDGIKAGNLRVKVFRPFPFERFARSSRGLRRLPSSTGTSPTVTTAFSTRRSSRRSMAIIISLPSSDTSPASADATSRRRCSRISPAMRSLKTSPKSGSTG